MTLRSWVMKGLILVLLMAGPMAVFATKGDDWFDVRLSNRGISVGFGNRDFGIRVDLANRSRYDRNRYDDWRHRGYDYRYDYRRIPSGRDYRFDRNYDPRSCANPVRSGASSGKYLGPTRGIKRYF